MRPLVILPTYNEAPNIANLIPEILRQDNRLEVLVVDDNSPDGTAEIVEKTSQQEARVHLLQRPGKGGLGTAYIDGFRYALREGYDPIFEMDADFSHDPQELPAFLKRIETCDLVVGSRYCHGRVSVVNWPLPRLILSYGANVYARLVTGLPLTDCTGGFKCFRRGVLERLDWSRVKSNGYGFQIVTVQALPSPLFPR